MQKSEMRKLPSVDKLMQVEQVQALVGQEGHGLVIDVVRAVLDRAREGILDGAGCPAESDLVAMATEELVAITRPSLQPVINATGVIIHTNLGRAPLSEAAMTAMRQAAGGYSNLEFDLSRGRRGSRYDHAEALLCRLTGAEAAFLVNNNASAVLLTLMALGRGREVVISRGQLVEIGGGFRVPDVMAQSGALLTEVGTTNRTYLRDYAGAITEQTALLMRVHSSNFRVMGFVHEVSLADLAVLAAQHDLCVIDDLGSGTLLDTAEYGLAHEPMVQESVAAGADVVTFSGDKLLGGPQAGIIVGKRDILKQLKHHPLARALRVDKIAIAGLQATLLHYLKGDAKQEVPIWRMIAASSAELTDRATALAGHISGLGINVAVVDGRSTVGGGSLPGETLPTRLVAISVPSADGLARSLRLARPALVGRIERDRLMLDPRTIPPAQDEVVARCVAGALKAIAPKAIAVE